jgi:hypothetical protein
MCLVLKKVEAVVYCVKHSCLLQYRYSASERVGRKNESSDILS